MRKEGGITLIALIITVIILIILTGITISNVTKSNLFGLAKSAVDNYIKAGEEEQEALNKIMKYLKKDKDEESKPKLPEVDMTTTITCVNDWDKNTYLGEDPTSNVYIRSSEDGNTFNDDIFTVNNYKVVEI